jgi:hypothetical protein
VVLLTQISSTPVIVPPEDRVMKEEKLCNQAVDMLITKVISPEIL